MKNPFGKKSLKSIIALGLTTAALALGSMSLAAPVHLYSTWYDAPEVTGSAYCASNGHILVPYKQVGHGSDSWWDDVTGQSGYSTWSFTYRFSKSIGSC
jgi:hypothetical protein